MFQRYLKPLLIHCLSASPLGALAAIGPKADLRIVNGEVSPDGYARQAVLAGGTFPGPLISGNKGDRFEINVIDELTNHTMLKSTSIHWHGVLQHGTNWADGAASVNQCPITTGQSFLYNFTTREYQQSGTHWYHSHLSTQYCDGLRGPLIIYDPDDPHKSLYDVDDESTVMTLSDWYHTAARLGPTFPPSDSVLINGKGRSWETLTANLSVVEVQPGKRYRIRLISMSCDPSFTFSIDGHNMTIIEVDGVNHQPLVVNQLQIYAGMRYSFVLEANQKVDNYWIRAIPDIGNTNSTTAHGLNSAILRYHGAPEQEPSTTAQASVIPLKEVDLHPLDNPAAPGEPRPGGADYSLNLAMGFDEETLKFSINGVTFVPPSVPVLLQILSGARNAQELMPYGSVFPLPANKTIEISIPAIQNEGSRSHPFHLHGQTFSVVRSEDSSVYNYENPVRRDVVSMGKYNTENPNNVTIRFRTDNPGPWYLHCHIDWHLEAGLAIIFAEDTPETVWANPVPEAWNQLCPLYDALNTEDT